MIRILLSRFKTGRICLLFFLMGFLLLPIQGMAKKIKKRTSSEVGALKRDPFWPVGFIPKNKGPQKVVVGDVDWKKAMNSVRINAVSKKGTEAIAIINNRKKKVGDTVSVNYKGHRYEWIVESITTTKNAVKLKPKKVE